jgi:hypothetical protein
MNNVLTKKYLPTLNLNEFLEESKIFVQEYSCPVCEGILNDSVIDNCGHSYCRECISTLLKETNLCPFTNKEIIQGTFTQDLGNIKSTFQLSPNIILNSAIEKQKVFCKNKFHDPNCTWVGKLMDRKNHLLHECEKELVKCDNSDECTIRIPRNQFQKHLNECPYRTVLCNYCRKYVNFNTLIMHYKTCENYPIECPNKCGEKISSNFINSHLELYCNNSIAVCPYHIIGCEYYDLRKLLKVHLEENLEMHMKLLNEKIQNLQNITDTQSEEINKLKLENQIIRTELLETKSLMEKNNQEFRNSLKFLTTGLENMRMYINIPITNYVPNFNEYCSDDLEPTSENKSTIKTKSQNQKNISNINKIFEINYTDYYSLCKICENSGWYGISSRPIFSTKLWNSTSTSSNFNYDNANEKITINMKIKKTNNSCIMFGITFSDLPSPLKNGFYSITEENNCSIMFYCYNSSIYYQGRSSFVKDSISCIEGDVISLLFETGNNTVSFKKNGVPICTPIEIKLMFIEENRMKMRIAIDLCDYLDQVIFME